ncbi:MAG: cobalamin-independent methionine synthase II family protein [Rhodospirillaceae bacterium]|nr:cobalamin-independent methionine synthase II family protein [Rhodospirillaceae bacterium]MBT3493270.1 cobalamin-independent methionine synthase II family protein [Rhodospirillaceae bacterium]MBT3782172.1 cobalamin-independent methionine synthase II family protein [Rhodospirillaceae bacterium]MBT3977691.1 cobalamin-independent methionine synthase II family protein [Rhodospirillaceae bacterium]MBT4168683.1 cobalamin-independent methionine synthase II family protein [Rhodospirillaceae bacterium
MMTSKIKTTVVGSYPVPAWLAAAPSEQALTDATRVVLHTQEQAGIDVVCDGEMYRFDVNHPETNGMIEYFVRPMGGIRTEINFSELLDYRSQEGMGFRRRPPAVVDGPINGGSLDLPGACEAAKALTDKPLKFTLTGPHMLAKTVVDQHYGDVAKVADAIADALAEQVRHCHADVVQLDEANLPGHPDEWEWAAAAINKVLDAIPSPGIGAVHLCFGNYGGQSIQKGSWDKLLGYLNALHVDHIVMENAHRPVEELAAFKELRPEIGMGMGVVDIKRTDIESADAIATQIEKAEALLGADRVKYIHPDCGFWMLPRNVADGKIRALVAGRDLYEGK